jgi:hypothetical protein
MSISSRGKSAPFNFGYVASEVVIFPTASSSYPLKSRNRQFNEMFFNEVTLKNMNAVSGKENLEMVSDGNAGSGYGVTLSPKFSLVDTNFNVNSHYTEWSKSLGKDSVLTTSKNLSTNLNAKYWHNSWMPTNSIFTSSAQDSDSGEIPWSNIPEHYYGTNLKTITTDRHIVNNFLHSLNPKFQIYPKKIVGPDPEKENAAHLDITFIGNSNTYNGDFIRNIPEEILDKISPSGTQIVGPKKQFPGAKDGSKFRVVQNLPPGVHCGLRKQFENFHGQDFVYSFERLSFDHSLPNNSVNDKTNFYFNLSREHSSLDPVGFPDENVQSVGDVDISSNYGMRNTYDKNSKTWSNNGFYLGSQPYIVLELPNQSPNNINEYDSLYIIIPKNGNVVVVNCSKKIRQITVPSKDNSDIFSKYIIKPRFRMSKIIYDFGFSGSELLSQQNFSIKIQHLMGSLQISFSGGRSYIVSEESYNMKALNPEVFDQLAESGGFIYKIDQTNESSFIPEKDGIMLHGRPRVFWGNSQYAVNVSPIEYHSEAKIKPNYPISILGRFTSDNSSAGDDGGLQAAEQNLFLLLRSRIEPTSEDDGFSDNDITKYFDDFRRFVFKNQSLFYGEIISGKLVEKKATIMPARFSNYIPGCCLGKNDSGSGTGGFRFKYKYFNNLSENARRSGGISISKNEVKKRGINKDSNLDNFSFGVFVEFTLKSGPIELLHPFSPDGNNSYFGSFIRPVMFGYSSLVREDNSPAVNVFPKNISNLVKTYKETWVKEGNSFIRHTASLQLYIPKDLSMRDLVSGRRVNSAASKITRFGDAVSFDSDVRKFIMSLQDKAFYVRVYLARMLNNLEDDDSSATYDKFHPDFDGGATNLIGGQSSSSEFKYLAFTGICNQINFTMNTSHIEVSMELEDYSRILEDTKFLNPPFYDAMRDYDAVYDLLSCAGLREVEVSGASTGRGSLPMDFLKYMISQDSTSGDRKYIPFNDRTVIYANYVLPGNYDPLNNARFKPNFGDNHLSFIKRISDVSGKTFYFDNAGIARFEIPPDEIEYFSNNNSTSSGDSSKSPSSSDPVIKFQHIDPFNEIHDFYTSVDYNKFAGTGKFRIWNVIDAGSFSFNKKVSDIYNEIRVVTTTPDMKLLLAGHLNVNSIYDPSSPGFLGYRKMFLQKDGVFGSKEALQKIVNRYTMFFNPPLFCSFSVPGRNGIMPNQYFRLHYGSGFKRGINGNVEIGNNNKPAIEPLYILGIIISVNNEIDKKTNRWSTNISGRYMYPGEIIDFRDGEDTRLSVQSQ